MKAFGNELLNTLYAQGLAEDIIAILVRCCKKMKADALDNTLLPNHEVKITNRLFHSYLENEHVYKLFHFQLQTPENYNPETDLYAGIGDISVTPWNMLSIPRAYFLIECKRIDGSHSLNEKYVKEGIQRFVGSSPKYISYYGRSIMLGYVVSSIDIPENTITIGNLQAKLLVGASADALLLIWHNSEWYVYSSKSTSEGTASLVLDHLFYDFSGAVEATA